MAQLFQDVCLSEKLLLLLFTTQVHVQDFDRHDAFLQNLVLGLVDGSKGSRCNGGEKVVIPYQLIQRCLLSHL